MKIRITFALFALFTLNLLTAQSPAYDFAGRILYMPVIEGSTSSNYNFSRSSIINDSTYILSNYEATSTERKNYISDLGYEISAGIRFKISDKMSLRTGLAVNHSSIGVASISSTISQNFLSSDTMQITPVIGTPTTLSFCDVYTNDFVGIEASNEIKYNLTNIRVPLELVLDLINERLRLNLGAYLQTPIVTKRTTESVLLNRELIDGQHFCEYILNIDIDTSGGDINNLQLGFNISADYHISKNISLELGALRDFTNQFTPNESLTNNFSEELYPGRYYIGLRYTLGQPKIEN